MLQLRAFLAPGQADDVVARLVAVDGIRHLLTGGRTAGGMVQLTADVDPGAADEVLDVLRQCDLASDDVTLWRAPSVRPLGWRRRRRAATTHNTAVWAEVMGHAEQHAQPNVAFVLFMVTAGVIAGVGVLTVSSILIVGAMAVSPDLLPISAAAVGLAEQRWALALRAWLTLAAGLVVTGLAATTTAWILRAVDRIPDDLDPAASVLGLSLTTVGPGTVLVATAAGVAGMLAYESAGGIAVGVAISVTTIPVAAFAGTAIGMSDLEHLDGALAVLGVNVVTIVVAGALTVLVTVALRRRVAGAPG